MVIHRILFVVFVVFLILIGTSCGNAATPTVQFVEQMLTATAFINAPENSNPLAQSGNEDVQEFVARIAARDISSSRSVLIALTEVIDNEMLWAGVSSNTWDIQKCWIYETDSKRECTGEDKENYFRGQNFPKIFFAPAYSTSTESLFIIEYFHYWNEEFPMDMYRLVIELRDGKWIKKSILPYFW